MWTRNAIYRSLAKYKESSRTPIRIENSNASKCLHSLNAPTTVNYVLARTRQRVSWSKLRQSSHRSRTPRKRTSITVCSGSVYPFIACSMHNVNCVRIWHLRCPWNEENWLALQPMPRSLNRLLLETIRSNMEIAQLRLHSIVLVDGMHEHDAPTSGLQYRFWQWQFDGSMRGKRIEIAIQIQVVEAVGLWSCPLSKVINSFFFYIPFAAYFHNCQYAKISHPAMWSSAFDRNNKKRSITSHLSNLHASNYHQYTWCVYRL